MYVYIYIYYMYIYIYINRASYRNVDLSLESCIVERAQDSLLRRSEHQGVATSAATAAADVRASGAGGGAQGRVVREQSEGFLASMQAIAALEEAERKQAEQMEGERKEGEWKEGERNLARQSPLQTGVCMVCLNVYSLTKHTHTCIHIYMAHVCVCVH